MPSHHARQIATCDAETEPFRHGNQDVGPFIWGYYDKKEYREFSTTEAFVDFVKRKRIILYAHNGGKFDFRFLLKYIGESRVAIINGRIVSMYLGECELRDSLAAIPLALREFGGKKEIHMSKLRKKNRDKHMDEIREYLFHDCKSLYDVVARYRETVGKKKTIASNALADAVKRGMDPGRTNWRFDSTFRKYYFGGRTVCPIPGTHLGGSIFDIRSAYPFAMSHYHATGTRFRNVDTLDGLTYKQINRAFITLECYSAGAFPKRTKKGLEFPHAFDTFDVSGWEYNAAMDLGLLRDVKIIEAWVSREKPITFKPYVDYWFKRKKEAVKNSIDYTIAKIMLNSLYGKMAENPMRYKDYVLKPYGTRVDRANGWRLSDRNPEYEIHSRDVMWEYQDDDGEIIEGDEEWKGKRMFRNVATAASITGFTRAHWLRAAHAVGIDSVIYGDTDSLHVTASANIAALNVGEELGQWELEATFSEGHYAGKKLYAVQLHQRDKKGRPIRKVKTKGARMGYRQFVNFIMRGEEFIWRSQAPNLKLDGRIEYPVRRIRGTAISAAIAAE